MFSFTFWKKPSVIHVDAFTFDPSTYEHTPIVNTKETIPDWYNSLKVYTPPKDKISVRSGGTVSPDGQSTLRHCYGINELYKKGLVIEYWNNTLIEVSKNRFNTDSEREMAVRNVSHPSFQYSPGFENHHHLKFGSPWNFREKTGVQWLLIPATWSHETECVGMNILPGILNFRYQTQTNINVFFPMMNQKYQVRISQGTPLVQLVPLTDKAVKVTNHLISYGEWGEMMRTLEGQPLRFYRKMKLLKRNDKREINRGRCPFSFTYVNKDNSGHNEIQ